MQEVYWSLAWKTNNGNYVPLGQRECHWKLRCKWIADTGPQILTSDLTSLDFERLYKIAGQTHPANNCQSFQLCNLHPVANGLITDSYSVSLHNHGNSFITRDRYQRHFPLFLSMFLHFSCRNVKKNPFNSIVLKLCKTLNRPDYSISLPAAKECVIQNWKLQH